MVSAGPAHYFYVLDAFIEAKNYLAEVYLRQSLRKIMNSDGGLFSNA